MRSTAARAVLSAGVPEARPTTPVVVVAVGVTVKRTVTVLELVPVSGCVSQDGPTLTTRGAGGGVGGGVGVGVGVGVGLGTGVGVGVGEPTLTVKSADVPMPPRLSTARALNV